MADTTTTVDAVNSVDAGSVDTLSSTISSAASSVGISAVISGANIKFNLAGGGTILNVNIPQIQTFGAFIKEIQSPKVPFGQIQQVIDAASTSPLAKGNITNTAIGQSNQNLYHNCGFLNELGFASSIISSVTSITSIVNTIKKPKKYGRSAAIRIMFGQISKYVRLAVRAIVDVMAIDPTGIASTIFSQAKAVLRYISKELRYYSRLARNLATIAYITTNLNELVNYIKSIPARILSVIKNCVVTFLGSVNQITNAINAIPNITKEGSVGATLTTLKTNTISTVKQVSNTTVPNSPQVVQNAINNPTSVSKSDVTTYVTNTYGTQKTTLQNVSNYSYSTNNQSQP